MRVNLNEKRRLLIDGREILCDRKTWRFEEEGDAR